MSPVSRDFLQIMYSGFDRAVRHCFRSMAGYLSGPAAAVDETSPMARAMSSALNSMSASFGLLAVSPPSHSGKISYASVSSSLGVLNTELYCSVSRQTSVFFMAKAIMLGLGYNHFQKKGIFEPP